MDKYPVVSESRSQSRRGAIRDDIEAVAKGIPQMDDYVRIIGNANRTTARTLRSIQGRLAGRPEKLRH